MNRSWCISTLILMTTLALAGCIRFDVKEQDFFLPDNRVNAETLKAQFPAFSMQSLSLSGHDGTRLYGEYFSTPNARLTIVYWGGNQFRIRDGAGPIIEAYLPHPINLLLMDHRGYGGSEGRPSLNDLQRDGVAVYDQIRQRFPGLPIVVNGYSLGSFTAAFVAGQREVDGIILEASAPDAQAWANAQVPWFAKPFVDIDVEASLRHIDNEKVMRQQQGSVMILVGDEDDFTPPALSEQLFEAARNARYRDFVLAANAGHGKAKRMPEFQRALPRFIDSISPRLPTEASR